MTIEYNQSRYAELEAQLHKANPAAAERLLRLSIDEARHLDDDELRAQGISPGALREALFCKAALRGRSDGPLTAKQIWDSANADLLAKREAANQLAQSSNIHLFSQR